MPIYLDGYRVSWYWLQSYTTVEHIQSVIDRVVVPLTGTNMTVPHLMASGTEMLKAPIQHLTPVLLHDQATKEVSAIRNQM